MNVALFSLKNNHPICIIKYIMNDVKFKNCLLEPKLTFDQLHDAFESSILGGMRLYITDSLLFSLL